EEEVERRLRQYGHNVVAQEQRYTRMRLLGKAMINPLVSLLLVLAILSYLTGDVRAAVVMLLMVCLGVVLRFVQETRADAAAAQLKAMISVTATVLRAGEPKEVPLADVVPGDIVKLAAGDMIPADLRLISCKDLFIIQSSLTGEAFPVEKFDTPEVPSPQPLSPEGRGVGVRVGDTERSPLELRNICFLGTSAESATALGIIAATGPDTYLGGMSP